MSASCNARDLPNISPFLRRSSSGSPPSGQDHEPGTATLAKDEPTDEKADVGPNDVDHTADVVIETPALVTTAAMADDATNTLSDPATASDISAVATIAATTLHGPSGFELVAVPEPAPADLSEAELALVAISAGNRVEPSGSRGPPAKPEQANVAETTTQDLGFPQNALSHGEGTNIPGSQASPPAVSQILFNTKFRGSTNEALNKVARPIRDLAAGVVRLHSLVDTTNKTGKEVTIRLRGLGQLPPVWSQVEAELPTPENHRHLALYESTADLYSALYQPHPDDPQEVLRPDSIDPAVLAKAMRRLVRLERFKERAQQWITNTGEGIHQVKLAHLTHAEANLAAHHHVTHEVGPKTLATADTLMAAKRSHWARNIPSSFANWAAEYAAGDPFGDGQVRTPLQLLELLEEDNEDVRAHYQRSEDSLRSSRSRSRERRDNRPPGRQYEPPRDTASYAEHTLDTGRPSSDEDATTEHEHSSASERQSRNDRARRGASRREPASCEDGHKGR